MWSMLCLVAAVVTPPPETGRLAFGTRVRLSAAPRIDGSNAKSGDSPTLRYAVPVRREGPLLIFTYADGSTSSALLPGASVTGTLAGCDESWVHLSRSRNQPPIRIHRAAVARVEVAAGRRHPVGQRALLGLGAGLVVGAGLMSAGCRGQDECWLLLPVGVALSGALGAGLGSAVGFVGETGWREVPLNWLGAVSATSGGEVKSDLAEKEADTRERGPGPGKLP
jgi:hypothetical protein